MSEPPRPPRLAATILLLRDDPFEVLMVRRSEWRGDFYSAALVFPGGAVDPGDRAEDWLADIDGAEGLDAEERALRIAGCRETLEEAGILLARDAHGACPPARDCGNGESFHAMIRSLGARLQLDAFAHFGHWVTPPVTPRRFDTHFFLARAPDGAEAHCDGGETVALEWIAPQAALERGAAGDNILFPTRMNLKRLAESDSVASAFAAAAVRERFTVQPTPEQRGGRTVITIPEAAGYGVTEDWR
jgi:8-oxo-dGTP pyrophosphatase MutT (NUDIX family)